METEMHKHSTQNSDNFASATMCNHKYIYQQQCVAIFLNYEM